MRSSADDHSAPVSGASDQQDQAEYQSMRVAASTPSKAFFFDIMGTLVRDPFFEDMYRHFGFATHADFIAAKHPETWIRFERGEVSATELARLFFRPRQTLSPALARYAKFDPDRFESYLRDSYAFLDEGMESLLAWLASKRPRYTVHAFSNYPRYYRLIEEKLNLSRYLQWTAVSCEIGVRKPAPEAYIEAARRAGVPLSHCVLIDDQQRNIEGARKAGFGAAILFPGTSASLWPQLRASPIRSRRALTMQLAVKKCSRSGMVANRLRYDHLSAIEQRRPKRCMRHLMKTRHRCHITMMNNLVSKEVFTDRER
ncbi:hypothetical protein F1559_003652 [Cyanidiococcus yangmingshanensis]|uniref:Uncharacterized protein n=1 Tax=Cyanidiococcus yangmingshanensis TaxID=2690220 RepID=A0A7J7IJ74_9RHOD|nr:hypothetical protein F1559_003652 [Cyanidiococcus yangmingshanensis]